MSLFFPKSSLGPQEHPLEDLFNFNFWPINFSYFAMPGSVRRITKTYVSFVNIEPTNFGQKCECKSTKFGSHHIIFQPRNFTEFSNRTTKLGLRKKVAAAYARRSEPIPPDSKEVSWTKRNTQQNSKEWKFCGTFGHPIVFILFMDCHFVLKLPRCNNRQICHQINAHLFLTPSFQKKFWTGFLHPYTCKSSSIELPSVLSEHHLWWCSKVYVFLLHLENGWCSN